MHCTRLFVQINLAAVCCDTQIMAKVTWEKLDLLAPMDQKVKEENRDQKEMGECSDLKD